MSAPNDIATALAWLQDCGRLDSILAVLAPRVDRYQDVTLEYGDHPDVTTADLSPDDGFAPCGPWKPYAAIETEDRGEYGRFLRTVTAGVGAGRCGRSGFPRVRGSAL